MKIALLVIDMQHEFFMKDQTAQDIKLALEWINPTIDLFHQAKQTVIFVQDEEAGEGPGSDGFDLFKDLNRKPEDHVLSKFYSNAFWKTDLEDILKDLKIDFLVICGFAAEFCVNYTYNGALERGFKATILQNGISGFDKTYSKMIHEICNVTSYNTIEFLLKI